MHNADILLDIDFARLIETHLSSGNIATLVTVTTFPKSQQRGGRQNGLVLNVENPGDSRPDPDTVAEKVAYTGIAVYSPEILKFLSSRRIPHDRGLDRGGEGRASVQALTLPEPTGTTSALRRSYAASVLDALRENGETVYVSPAAACGKIDIDGYIVMESRSEVRDDARLRNCIVMPDARVSGRHENRILGPDYAIALSGNGDAAIGPCRGAEAGLAFTTRSLPRISDTEPNRLSLRTPNSERAIWSDAILIGLGGSDRRYFRVRNNGKTAVLMECRPDDPDYERHLIYTRFFEAHAVPVPGLIASDDDDKRALFEDLGDTSLYSYLKLPHDDGRIEDIYRSVLDILVALHGRVTAHVSRMPAAPGADL